mgnify:CR=1 FL=1|jgi:8-amino-7-oxononanoate synthase
MVDLSSNDYLGFARDPEFEEEVRQFLDEQGSIRTGSTGSRLLTGNSPLHLNVEESLARLYEAETALLFNSGYDANLGLLGSVPQRGDLVLYDSLVHASIRDGLQLSKARNVRFDHLSMDDLDRKFRINSNAGGQCYVVTESVFSMDGDSPDLLALAEWCEQNNCLLIVDEAHAVGVFGEQGRGLIPNLDLCHKVFARVVTFGKALGCHGAAVLAGDDLREYLVNFARSLIYTTSLPAHTLAAILVGHRRLLTSPRIALLKERRLEFVELIEKYGLSGKFLPSNSAIHACVVPGNSEARSLSHELAEAGFDVRPVLAPTVSEGSERLRFCIHAYNTTDEFETVMQLLTKYLLE